MTPSAACGPLALQALVGLVAGAAAGFVYFRALWWNVALFERGATPGALALLAARFFALAAVLTALALCGALALLAGAGGLLAARRAALRKFGKP